MIRPMMKKAEGGRSSMPLGTYQPPLLTVSRMVTPKSDACAKQLADEANQHQDQAIAQPVADIPSIKDAIRGILHGKSFGAAHHDTVGDDQTDKTDRVFEISKA